MNKLFTKIVGVALGLTMAVGVGVAVASSASDAKQVSAADSSYQKVSSLSADKEVLIVTHSTGGQYYLMDAVTGATSAGPKYITCSLSNSKITGDYDSHLFTVSASSTNWKFATGSKYLKWSGTSSNTAIRINTGDSNNTWTYSNGTMKFSSADRYLGVYTSGSDWRSYNSSGAANYSGTGANIEFYEKAKTTQTITASADEAYSDESVTLTTNATSATWSITSGGSYAHLSSTSGKSVSLIGDAAGSVTVKAVASGYTDATKTITFNERPAGTFYDVTFDSNGGSSSPAKQSILENETFTFPSPGTKTHYSFAGWSSDGGTTKYATGATSPAVIADIEYTAYWTEDAKVTVTYTAGTNASGSYTHSNQYVGSYSLLALSSLSGITYDSSTYRLKDYVVGGVSKQPGDSITLSAAITVTVNFEEIPLEYQVIFGTADGTSGITEFSNTSYVIPSGVTLDHIQGNVYSNTSNQAASLRFGKSGTTGSFDASISGNYYIVSVKCNLKYYGSDTTATFAVTPDGGSAISKSLTNSWADYTYDVSAAQAKKVTLGTDVNGKRAYLSGFTITYAAQKTLSNIALSGTYPTSFTKGDTFSHAGMVVTANYSDSTSATVTTSATWSSPDMSTTGNKTVTVSYSDEYGSASKTYSITVNYAAVTSVSLSENAAGIGLGEVFDYNLVIVTVSPSNANPAVTWSVDSNTVGDDYIFDASGLLAGDTEGTITLKCESDADSSKYATLVVTVTGDPVVDIIPASVSGYVGKSVDVDFTYGNIDNEELIDFASSNPSVLTVGDHIEDSGEGSVTINFVGAGNATLSVSYNGGSTLDSITVTVSTDSVTALTWSAPTIKVYSGATTSVSDASSWNVHYTMASGDEDDLSYGEYTLKLGGSAITLPHTWDASEDGKVLSIEYGGFASPTTSTVDVTQSLQAVNMPNEGDSYYQLVETQADLEAGRYLIVSKGDAKAFDGSLATLDAPQNNFDVTITDGVIANDSTSSGKYFDLTVENSAWTITSASGKNVGHSTSGNGMNGTGTNTITISDGIATILGTGGKGLAYNSASGSTNERFRYYTSPATNANHSVSLFKLVTEEGEGSTNIANVAGHEAAQKAVVAFAKAMNAAFDNTANCTDGVAAAWATASSAYSSNIANNALLSDDEKAYAKNLIKYASAQYTDDTDNDYSYCLERAMATYEACIQKHGQTAFMSDVRSVSASPRIASLSFINGNGNTVAIIVIISMISVAAIGGYFFLRKRKED